MSNLIAVAGEVELFVEVNGARHRDPKNPIFQLVAKHRGCGGPFQPDLSYQDWCDKGKPNRRQECSSCGYAGPWMAEDGAWPAAKITCPSVGERRLVVDRWVAFWLGCKENEVTVEVSI